MTAHQSYLSSLSPEQRAAYDAVAAGQSVCITGPGGTGKSHLLNGLRDYLSVRVTASTGIAALNVGGSTIHSFAGLGYGDKPAEEILKSLEYKQAKFNDGTLDRLQKVQRLAIDEVSMMSAELLDTLSDLLKLARMDFSPFGGVQMIFLGDFLQLPPVVKKGVVRFAFEATDWKNVKLYQLTKTFRQSDQQFADILNEIRLGKLSPAGVSLLNSRFNAPDPEPEKLPLVLHTHNAGCDELNMDGLLQILHHEPTTYPSSDSGVNPAFIDQLDKNCLAPKVLALKPTCRVMLLRNLDVLGGLANGSLGTVTELERDRVIVDFDDVGPHQLDRATWEITDGEKSLAKRVQFPLRLAYAVTVHKSQGMTLSKLRAHLSNCFAPGQAYVALSRAKSIPGLFLTGSLNINITAAEKAVKFYQQHA